MHIIIRSTKDQKEELLQKGFNASVTVEWISDGDDFIDANADAFFDLIFNDEALNKESLIIDKPFFVHAVNCCCKKINKKNYIRLNAWPGFLSRPIFELAICDESYKKAATDIFNTLNWKFFWVPDDYGLVAARIIAMIINEAYYALQENVSTKEQIDIAMKLGTNYPFGPFEWSERIGLKNVYALLQKLSTQNKRYTIAEALQKAAESK